MPEIKWIKITTEMFDDEKIRIIEAMPEADALIVIWIRLICMAGKVNAGGHIFIAPDLPYTIEELATVVNRPLNTVKLAIATYERLKMIERTQDGSIFLPAFEKHQNIEGMERVREQARLRMVKSRVKKKQLLLPEAVTQQSVTVTQQIRIDKIRIRIELDEKERTIFDFWEEILDLLKTKVSTVNFTTWLADSVGLEIQSDTLLVGVPTESALNYLGQNQKSLIENCLASAPITLAHKVDFVLLS